MAKKDVAAQDQTTVERLTQLAARLRDSLHELGLEPGLEQAAQKVPHAHERLRYIAALTEQAATTSLNNSELAQEALKPIEEKARLEGDEQTLAGTEAINRALLEIILAQGFQDLTGQVILKLVDLISEIDRELIAILVEYAQIEVDKEVPEETSSLLNGPVVTKTDEHVAKQDDVDDLLASLGL